jgi:hypothetical protein
MRARVEIPTPSPASPPSPMPASFRGQVLYVKFTEGIVPIVQASSFAESSSMINHGDDGLQTTTAISPDLN